jgi:hypothetical protein
MRVLNLSTAVVFALCVCRLHAQETAVPALPPPPAPTYPEDVAVMPTRVTFPNALVAARKWHNSSLVVIRSAAENEEVRQALMDAGVQRAWIGGYRDSATVTGFNWIDGSAVGGGSRPYTNWAPGRPKADAADTAIVMDMATGVWFDIAQGTPTAAAVHTPIREVTQTEPLPAFEFPPGVPPHLRTPAWQTGIVVSFSLLTVVMVCATVALMLWHMKTPLRVDNRLGFVAPAPLDHAPPVLPKKEPTPGEALDSEGGEKADGNDPAESTKKEEPRGDNFFLRTKSEEPYRYLDQDLVRQTQGQLGKPLEEFDQAQKEHEDERQKKEQQAAAAAKAAEETAAGQTGAAANAAPAPATAGGSKVPPQPGPPAPRLLPSPALANPAAPKLLLPGPSAVGGPNASPAPRSALPKQPLPAARKLPGPTVVGGGGGAPAAGAAGKGPVPAARKLPAASPVGNAAKGPMPLGRKLPPSRPM